MEMILIINQEQKAIIVKLVYVREVRFERNLIFLARKISRFSNAQHKIPVMAFLFIQSNIFPSS